MVPPEAGQVGDYLGPVLEAEAPLDLDQAPEALVLQVRASEAPDEDLERAPEAMALLVVQAPLVQALALAREADPAPLGRRG